jgi:hypothetical protein
MLEALAGISAIAQEVKDMERAAEVERKHSCD